MCSIWISINTCIQDRLNRETFVGPMICRLSGKRTEFPEFTPRNGKLTFWNCLLKCIFSDKFVHSTSSSLWQIQQTSHRPPNNYCFTDLPDQTSPQNDTSYYCEVLVTDLRSDTHTLFCVPFTPALCTLRYNKVSWNILNKMILYCSSLLVKRNLFAWNGI